MKRLLYALIASVSFMGCSDLLDTAPHDKYTAEATWSNATLAQSFINNSYVDISKEYIDVPDSPNKAQLGAASDIYTDNLTVANGQVINQSTMTITDDFGWDRFNLIRQANVIIAEATKSTAFDTPTQADLIAQGKFLRAMVYFKLAKVYGRCVVVDKVLSANDNLYIPRTETVKETYDFIVKDLQEAAVDLKANVTSAHISKGAAYALLAEVALQAAAYSESGADEFYTIAKEASVSLFELNKYSLTDYYSVFNDFDNAINNKEIILGYFLGKDQTQCHETAIYRVQPAMSPSAQHEDVDPKVTCITQGMGGGGYCPSQDLVNDYLVVDEDGVAKRWNETSYYKDHENGIGTAADVLFHNRDARLDASLVRDSSYYAGSLIFMRVGGNRHHASGVNGKPGSLKNLTGYYYRKSMHDKEALMYGTYINYHYVHFRLGRSYLNYAEACYRTDDIATAIEYLNKTRTTHGKLPALDAGASKEEFWEAYKIERRVELFFENDRYWSVLRWYKADGADYIPEFDKDMRTTLEISADGKDFYEITIDYNANVTSRAFMIWDKKKFLFPVPQSYIDESNGVITQTQGW